MKVIKVSNIEIITEGEISLKNINESSKIVTMQKNH